MKRCTQCQSYAINPSQHGRDGTRLDLCDVCFWRDTAETRAARIARMEEALKTCDDNFSRFAPDEGSRYGDSWKSVREALGRPNPWEKWTP